MSKKITLNKLNVRHRSIVTTPWKSSDDPRVTTISLAVSIRNLCKQSVNDLFLVNVSESLSSFMQRAVLCKRNHLIDELPHRTGSGSSRFDSAVFQQLRRESTEKSFPLVRWSVELRDSPPVSHGVDTTTTIDDFEPVLEATPICVRNRHDFGDSKLRRFYRF